MALARKYTATLRVTRASAQFFPFSFPSNTEDFSFFLLKIEEIVKILKDFEHLRRFRLISFQIRINSEDLKGSIYQNYRSHIGQNRTNSKGLKGFFYQNYRSHLATLKKLSLALILFEM